MEPRRVLRECLAQRISHHSLQGLDMWSLRLKDLCMVYSHRAQRTVLARQECIYVNAAASTFQQQQLAEA